MAIDPTQVLPEPIPQYLIPPAPPVKYPLPKRIALDGQFPKISGRVINEFTTQNWFFMNMPLIYLISSGPGGGPALKYEYARTANESSATQREFNSEVTESYEEITRASTSIANLATAFSIDRELLMLSQPREELRRQLAGKSRALTSLFNEMVIRGDCAVKTTLEERARGPASFDGLHKIVQKSSFHVWDQEEDKIDLTGLGYTMKSDAHDESNLWMREASKFMARIEELDPPATWILCNHDLKTALSELGRRMNTYQSVYDQFGHRVETVDGRVLVDMGRRCARADWIIKTEHAPIETRENPPDAQGFIDPSKTYVTRAYAGSFGEDTVSGIALPGPMVTITPPDLTTSGHVKKWDIDMHIGLAVFSRHAVGMFENICMPQDLVMKPYAVRDRVEGVY